MRTLPLRVSRNELRMFTFVNKYRSDFAVVVSPQHIDKSMEMDHLRHGEDEVDLLGRNHHPDQAHEHDRRDYR